MLACVSQAPGRAECLCPEDRGRPARTEIGQGMGIVLELIGSYGLWIVLAAVFLTMHWFGRCFCGGGHDHKLRVHGDQSSEDAPEGRAATGKVKEQK